MMLGTTREVELSTIQIGGLTGDFSLSVEVTKVNKNELLLLDNPRYEEIIKNHSYMKGVAMEDHDLKDKLPVHIILGASEFAKLKTEKPPRVGLPGQPVAELTRFSWTIMSPGKESVDVSSMLLAQTSQLTMKNYVSLTSWAWKIDQPTARVLSTMSSRSNLLEMKLDDMRQGYHGVETIPHYQTIELAAYVAWQV